MRTRSPRMVTSTRTIRTMTTLTYRLRRRLRCVLLEKFERLGTRCTRTESWTWRSKNIRVRMVSILLRHGRLICGYAESIRYLDVHPVMPDGSPPELKTQFNALLTPVLLNAALVAIKTREPRLALSLTTRALNLTPPISNTDQGKPCLPPIIFDSFSCDSV